jgi:hypothetical protein
LFYVLSQGDTATNGNGINAAMLEDPSAKTTIEEGKSTAVSCDVIPVETAKAKEEEEKEEKEKNSEKAKDEAERKVESVVATNIENGGDSSAAATDSCTSDVSDMRICDAAASVISAHPEAGESMPPSSDPDSDVISRDCNAMSSEARGVITSSLSEQVTIDLTQETAESSDTIIDLTAESTTADTSAAGLIIDLTTDPDGESAVSKSSSESSAKSRRSKRAPLAVYVPPRGRGPPPPASGATATKKTSAAESVLVPAPPPPSVVATEDAPGVDVTEQVIQAFSCNSSAQCV